MYLPFHWIPWRFNVCTNNIHYTCIHHRCEWMYATYLLIWCPSFYTIINLRSVIMSNLDYATWLQNSNEGDFIVFYFLRQPPALVQPYSPAARPAPSSKQARARDDDVIFHRDPLLHMYYIVDTLFCESFHTLQFVIFVFIPYNLWFTARPGYTRPQAARTSQVHVF